MAFVLFPGTLFSSAGQPAPPGPNPSQTKSQNLDPFADLSDLSSSLQGLPAGLSAGSFVGTSAPTHKSNSSWQANRPTASGTSWAPQAKPAPRSSEQLRSHFSVIGAREERGVRAPSFGKYCITCWFIQLPIGLEVEPLVPPSEPAKTAIFMLLTEAAPRKQIWICMLVS